ncbi:unnamed protein product, partial [Pylaiella littoralis]
RGEAKQDRSHANRPQRLLGSSPGCSNPRKSRQRCTLMVYTAVVHTVARTGHP